LSKAVKSLASIAFQIYKYLKYQVKGRIEADMEMIKNSKNRYSAFKILIRNEFKGGN